MFLEAKRLGKQQGTGLKILSHKQILQKLVTILSVY